MNKKTALVTGGGGFIGSALCEFLLENEYEIKILDDFSRGKPRNIEHFKDKIQLVQCDIRNFEDVKNNVEDVDLFFHFAAVNGTKFFYEMPEKVIEVNVIGTINVLKALEGKKISRFIFSSSSEAYGYPKYFPTDEKHVLQIMDPTNPRFSYSGSKIMGELMVVNLAKKFGFDYTILRFHNIYGPKMGNEHVIPEFLRKVILNEEFTVQGDGKQIRSFCHISDAVKGIFLSATKDEGINEIFNIGNDTPSTINQVIKTIEEVAGKKIEPKYNPESSQLKGSTNKRQPDISKAKNLLGYNPVVDLKEGITDTFQWYNKYFQEMVDK